MNNVTNFSMDCNLMIIYCFIVHIVVKDDKYLEFSKCNINMIKAGGKIWNIHIFSEDDYTEPESSLHDDSNCYFSLYLLTQVRIVDEMHLIFSTI